MPPSAARQAQSHAVDRDGRQKGFTRGEGRTLEQRENESSPWRPAVYHNDRRKQLRKEADEAGKYTYPHARGEKSEDVDDRTSFLLVDKDVGYERAQRPDVLFEHLKPRGSRGSPPENPVYDTELRDGEKVILIDWNDHQINDFGDDLPITLSSQLDGQDIEMYTRRNKYISLADICGRMPTKYYRRKKTMHEPVDQNALNMRAARFRIKHGCLCWRRDSPCNKKDALVVIVGPWVQNNETRTLGRDLTLAEQETVKNAGNGSAPKKARTKAPKAKKPRKGAKRDTAVTAPLRELRPRTCKKRKVFTQEDSEDDDDSNINGQESDDGQSRTTRSKRRRVQSLVEESESESNLLQAHDDVPSRPTRSKRRAMYSHAEDTESDPDFLQAEDDVPSRPLRSKRRKVQNFAEDLQSDPIFQRNFSAEQRRARQRRIASLNRGRSSDLQAGMQPRGNPYFLPAQPRPSHTAIGARIPHSLSRRTALGARNDQTDHYSYTNYGRRDRSNAVAQDYLWHNYNARDYNSAYNDEYVDITQPLQFQPPHLQPLDPARIDPSFLPNPRMPTMGPMDPTAVDPSLMSSQAVPTMHSTAFTATSGPPDPWYDSEYSSWQHISYPDVGGWEYNPSGHMQSPYFTNNADTFPSYEIGDGNGYNQQFSGAQSPPPEISFDTYPPPLNPWANDSYAQTYEEHSQPPRPEIGHSYHWDQAEEPNAADGLDGLAPVQRYVREDAGPGEVDEGVQWLKDEALQDDRA